MNALTAYELKIRGVSAVEDRLKNEEEVIISVRGKDRYVVMTLEKYARLREFELEMAVMEARADYEAGHIITVSVEEHMKRVTDAL